MSPLRPLPPPAVVVTVYNDLRGERSLPLLERLLAHAAPGDLGVCIHDPPGDDEARLAELVVAAGYRLWYGWGVDPDARRSVRDAAAITRRRARLAADRGAEVVELNGEAAWKAAQSDSHDRARAMIDACREGAPELAVGWSTFDGLQSHRLPAIGTILGPGGVDYAAPQVYAANPATPAPEDHRDARDRWDRAVRQHQALADRGTIRADVVPGRERCLPYVQVHGCTPACVAWLLDRADTSRAWALPTRCDEAGLVGIEAVLLARRETGRSAGAIARWQAVHGLAADGIVGPRTLAAMGLG